MFGDFITLENGALYITYQSAI